MKQQWRRLAERVNGLEVRQRYLLLGGLAVLLLAAWANFILPGLEGRAKAAKQERADVQRQIQELEAETLAVLARAQVDPNQPLREQQSRLVERIAEAELAIQQRTGNFVPPVQMAALVEELLLAHKGLELVRLESLPPEPIKLTGEKGEGGLTPVYRHGLVLEFTGDYARTLEFLRAVEGLSWHLFWEQLDITVEEHPRARVLLRVQTLSGQEAWIGA